MSSWTTVSLVRLPPSFLRYPEPQVPTDFLLPTRPAYSHSLLSYKLLIALLRSLPSPLRSSLLAHVYASLTAHHPSSSPSHAAAIHLLATRFLYDVPYDPSVRGPADLSTIDHDEQEVVRVEGEELVDAIAQAVEVYWNACQAEGKAGDVKVWEGFCSWLEEMQEFVDEENLVRFSSSRLFLFAPRTLLHFTNVPFLPPPPPRHRVSS